MKKTLLLIWVFALTSQTLFSQKFTTSQFLLTDYTDNNPNINDSVLLLAVKTVFGFTQHPIPEVLENANDTTYYASLKALIYFIPTNPEFFEVNLYRMETKNGDYFIKCLILEKLPGLGTSDVVGYLTLPFTLNDGIVKFKNYFNEKTKPSLLTEGNSNIYTTLQNKSNLRRIESYIDTIRTTYGFRSTDQRLYYIYFSKEDNPYSAVGLDDYCMSQMGTTIGVSNTAIIIFDKLNDGFFKHELAHFAFAGNLKSDFFNEGFASFLGGSSTKCNQQCDYKSLSDFLINEKSDSVFQRILEREYSNGIPYSKYFYPLGSFTIYLLVKKYGITLLQNAQVYAALNSKTNEEILTFIHSQFVRPNQSLIGYYQGELNKYLSNTR